jgi:hypothetical protein
MGDNNTFGIPSRQKKLVPVSVTPEKSEEEGSVNT